MPLDNKQRRVILFTALVIFFAVYYCLIAAKIPVMNDSVIAEWVAIAKATFLTVVTVFGGAWILYVLEGGNA